MKTIRLVVIVLASVGVTAFSDVKVEARVLVPAEVEIVGIFATELQAKGVVGVEFSAQIEHKIAEIRLKPVLVGVEATTIKDKNVHGLGEFVVSQIHKGKRGRDLADAIHGEMKRRGVGVAHKPDKAGGGKPDGVSGGPPEGKGGGKGHGKGK